MNDMLKPDMNTNDTQQVKEHHSIREDVMDAIKKGRVQMRPRWHFVLFSTLAALGVFIVLLTLLYTVSLALFFLRDSGALFAPSFGGRGWLSLLRSVSWVLMLFIAFFIIVLEVLVRRYAFVYRRSLLLSVVAIFVVIFAGGFVIAQTSFHRQMELYAAHNQLPGPLALAYGAPFKMPPPDVYHGTILSSTTDGFIINDQNGAGTTSVIVTSATRLPYGVDFSVGSAVVVVGDTVASGTVRAFGVREVDQ